MAEEGNAPGSVVWQDLTVPEADALRGFYARVAGWTFAEVDMGGYFDFAAQAADGRTVAGICHARGVNAGVPPQWLLYIQVEDVAGRATACRELGGRVLHGPRRMGGRVFCVIQDPAGAVAALIGPEGKGDDHGD